MAASNGRAGAARPASSRPLGTDGLSQAAARRRTVPWDEAAERAVLGACLADPAVLQAVTEDGLRPGDFFAEAHRWIYTACVDIWLAGGAVDTVTVAHRLDEMGRLEAVGGLAALTALVAELPTTVGIEHHARLVAKDARYRALAQEAARLQDAALCREAEPWDLLVGGYDRMVTAVGRKGGGTFRTAAEIAANVVVELEEILADPLAIRGEETGLAGLDAATGGLEPGRLYVLAASTSTGKTSLGLQVALHVARPRTGPDGTPVPGPRVFYNSLEMSGEQLAVHRAVFALAGVPRKHVYQPGHGWVERRAFTPEEQAAVRAALGQFAGYRLIIPDEGVTDARALRSRVRLMARSPEGIGLVVVDHLHRMDLPRDLPPSEGYGELVRELKDLAVECRVPVLLLAQLNREPEKEGRRPVLTDLRSSGRIEQEADFAGLLWRPSARVLWRPPAGDRVLEGRTPVEAKLAELVAARGGYVPPEYTELLCEKVRDGDLRTVLLWYDLRRQRWEDLAAVLGGAGGPEEDGP